MLAEAKRDDVLQIRDQGVVRKSNSLLRETILQLNGYYEEKPSREHKRDSRANASTHCNRGKPALMQSPHPISGIPVTSVRRNGQSQTIAFPSIAAGQGQGTTP